MRVLTCLLVLAHFGGSIAAAQGVTGGVKAGVSMASINSEPEEIAIPSGYRTGVAAGAFVAIPLAAHLSLQPEGLYVQKGDAADESGARVRLAIDYFEVPVLLKYSSGTPGAISAVLFAGPAMGFKLRTKATATIGGETHTEEFDEEVKGFDVGLAAGGGIDFGRFTVEARYTHGLTNINAGTGDETKVRNRAFVVMGGIRFGSD